MHVVQHQNAPIQGGERPRSIGGVGLCCLTILPTYLTPLSIRSLCWCVIIFVSRNLGHDTPQRPVVQQFVPRPSLGKPGESLSPCGQPVISVDLKLVLDLLLYLPASHLHPTRSGLAYRSPRKAAHRVSPELSRMWRSKPVDRAADGVLQLYALGSDFMCNTPYPIDENSKSQL